LSVTFANQSAQLPAVKAVRSESRAIHSQALQDVLAWQDRAFQQLFARVTSDEKLGYPRFRYPRFQGAGRYHSFTHKQFGNGATLDGAPKTVTISREADGWYVCFFCADAPIQLLPTMGRETGVDLGLEAFATLSAGTRIFSPGWRRKAERALKTAQRRVSRRKRGSSRRRKAVTSLAKAHQQVRRQRADFHHRTALALVRHYGALSHEDVQTANMLKNHRLAKCMQDAGWAAFLSILSFKAACAGRSVIAVSPAFTSRTCSGCGHCEKANRKSQESFHCLRCGFSANADHNAAINISRREWAVLTLRTGYSPAGSRFIPAGNPASPRRRCPRH
jgi:putative transposase